jgi:hypothetical protein
MECRKEAAEMRADAAGSKDERVRNALIAAAEQLESHGLYCAQRSLEQA